MIYFEHWGPEHITVLIIIAVVMAAVLIPVTLKADDKKTTTVLRCLAISHLVLEVIQDLLLVGENYDWEWMLPLHLCNLGIFVNLGAAFSKGKARSILAEMSLMLIMPGALGALLFPDWNYRPLLNPITITIFTTHTILQLIPLIMLIKGYCDIKFRHIIYPILFLIIIVPPIYWLDNKLRANYLFLRFPVEHSPLSFIYYNFTPKYYIPGLILLVTVVLSVEYLIAVGIRKLIALKRR